MSEHLSTAVVSVVTDNAGLNKGLSQAQAQTEAATKKMEETVGKRVAAVGDHMTKLGRNMTASMTVPILAAGGAATKLFSDYEASLSRVQTQAGASAKEIANMRGELLKMAPQVSQTPKELADGLYHIESAGFSGAQALNMLRNSAKLASLGNANLEDTTQGVIAVMASHIKGINGASQAMAGLNAVVGTGDTKMEDLAQAMSTGIMAVAANTGLQFKDVGAALATLTDNAMQAEPAAMRLRMSLALMAAPTKEAQDALKSVGIGATQLADDMHKPNGLLVAVEDLKTHLADSGKTAEQQQAIISNAFGGGQSSAAIQILIREIGRLEDKYKEQAKVMSPKTVSTAWDQYRKTQSSQIDSLKASAEASLIELGEAVGPQLLKVGKQVADDVESIANAFNSLPKEAQSMIVRGGIVMASMGPALRLAGILTTGVGRLYDAALIVKKLASGNGLTQFFASSKVATVSKAGAGGSAIGTMEVGTLIAREMVGTAVGGGTGAPVATTAVGTAAEEEAGAAGVATAEKGLLSSVGSKLLGGAGVGMAGMGISQMLGFILGGNTGKTVASIGTGASAGAGIGTMIAGPLGTAIGGVLGGSITEAIHLLKGKDYGKQIANAVFDKGFGGQAAKSLSQQVASELDQYHKLMGSGSKTAQWKNPYTGQWQGQAKTSAADQSAWTERFKVTGPSKSDVAKAASVAEAAGRTVAKQLEKGWDQYKFQSEPVMFSQFKAQAAKLPPAAQAAAADSAINFATKLESEGRLTKGSTKKLIDQIEGQFPALVKYMGLQAGAGAKAFQNKLNLTESEKKLDKQLKTIAGDFPQVQHAMSTTAGDAQDKAKAMVTALQSVNTQGSTKMEKQVTADLLSVANSLKDTKGRTSSATAAMVSAYQQVADKGTKPMRKQAQSDLASLQSKTLSSMQKMGDGVVSKMRDMTSHSNAELTKMAGGTNTSMTKIAQSAANNMGNFQDAVTKAMANGSLSAGQGMQVLITNLNRALKELGQKQLSQIQILSMKATMNPQGTTMGHRYAGATGAAQGALIQVGHPGTAGHDSVPMNVGGSPITVAPGEQVVVLNRHQQPIVNNALAREGFRGGLPGLFSQVTTPNYMARGGFVPGFAAGGVVGTVDQFFSSHGFDKTAIAGILGNAWQESSGNPNAPGGGLFQQISNFGAGTGGSLLNQLQTMLPQIMGLRAALNSAGSPGAAAEIFEQGFEKAGIPAMANRIAYANEAYAGQLGGSLSGAVAAALQQINPPTVKGTGVIADTVRAALSIAAGAANKYEAAHAPVMSGGAGPSTIMAPTGKGRFGEVEQMMDTAVQHILGTPYVYGGGHNDAFAPTNGGFDCSGAVSYILHMAGLLNGTPLTAGAGGSVMGYGLAGPGKYITIGSRGSSGEDAHMMLSYFGKYFEDGGGGPSGAANAHMDAGWDGSFNIWRHPAGFAEGGPVVGDLGEVASLVAQSDAVKAGTKAKKQPKLTPTQKAWAKALQRYKARGHGKRSVPPPVNSKHSGKQHVPVGTNLGGNGEVFGKDGPLPFKVNDLSPINSLLGSLMGIDGDGLGIGSGVGDVTNIGNQMTNLMNWWEAGLGAGGFPALAEPNFNSWDSPGDFVIDTTNADGTDSYSISPNINVVAQQLAQITGMEQSTIAELLRAKGISSQLAPTGGKPGNHGPVWKAIKRRQDAIQAIQKRIRANVKRIKAAKAKIKAFKADQKTQQSRANHASAQLRQLLAKQSKLQKDLRTEQKKKKPDHTKVAQLQKELSPIPGQLQHWNAVYGDASHRVVGDIAGEQYMQTDVIKPLEHENMVLGGKPDAVSNGGEIGQIAKQLGVAASTNPLGLVTGGGSDATGLFGVITQAQGWSTQLGGPAGDITAARMQLAEYQAGLQGLIPGANAEAAADAKAAAANNAPASPDTSQQDALAAAIQQQTTITEQTNLVTAAQTSVFAQLDQQMSALGRLPSFGGVFHTGGVVPGPLGAERMILAQGGEVVTPLGGGTEHHVIITKGPGVEQLIDARIEQKTRTMSRRAGRGLPGHGGGGIR